MTASWRLDTVVIGPESRGRNYGVLRRCGAPLSMDATARLNDFALSLTGWALRRLERFAAFFPLTQDEESFALVRAGLLGEGVQGPVAVANVAIVPRALLAQIGWDSPRLLRAVADPGDESFGATEALFRPDQASAKPAVAIYNPPNSAWADQVVDVGGLDPERVLPVVFAAIQPPAQRERVSSWVTTTLLAAVGQFDPVSIFRLVLHPEAEGLGRFAPSHVASRIDAVSLEGEAPEGWRMFARLSAYGRRADMAPLAPFAWSPAMADDTGQQVALAMLLQACLGLDPERQAALIQAVARRAQGTDALDEGLRHALGEVFAALTKGVGGEATAFYIQRLLTGADTAVAAAVPGLTARASASDVLGWLGAEVSALDAGVVAEQWLGLLEDEHWVERLRPVSPLLIGRVLEVCLTREPGDRRQWDRLAAGLLRLHSGNACDGRAPATPSPLDALKLLLDRAPQTNRPDLLDPAIIQLAWAQETVVAALIYKVAVPALRDAETEDGLAWAVMACIQAGERAA